MAFDPSSAAAGSLYMQGAGALSSIIGSFFSASAQKSSLKFQSEMADTNARIADTNARIAELGAQSTLMSGQKEVGRLTMKAGMMKSSQRASMAANGIDLGVGNAAEVQASTDIMKEIDSNQITANAVRSAWGYKIQALNARNESVSASNSALIKNATADGISPLSAAGTSLLSGAGKVAQSWYMMDKAGAVNNTPSTGAIGANTTPGYASSDLGNGIRF